MFITTKSFDRNVQVMETSIDTVMKVRLFKRMLFSHYLFLALSSNSVTQNEPILITLLRNDLD